MLIILTLHGDYDLRAKRWEMMVPESGEIGQE